MPHSPSSTGSGKKSTRAQSDATRGGARSTPPRLHDRKGFVMRIRFGEGKYDHVVALIRRKTNAKHAMAVVLDGNKGHGFAIHVGGVTQPERIVNTKRMIVAIAQLGSALVEGLSRLREMTPEQVMQAMHDEQRGNDPTVRVEPFDLEPSPPRCTHCGANLPTPTPPAAEVH